MPLSSQAALGPDWRLGGNLGGAQRQRSNRRCDDGTVCGTSGNDAFTGGGDADDQLHGYAGDDTLTGGAGDDYLYGGAGNDYLIGGEGDDRLWGDAGADVLHGGAGMDSLNYRSSDAGVTVNLTTGVVSGDMPKATSSAASNGLGLVAS